MKCSIGDPNCHCHIINVLLPEIKPTVYKYCHGAIRDMPLGMHHFELRNEMDIPIPDSSHLYFCTGFDCRALMKWSNKGAIIWVDGLKLVSLDRVLNEKETKEIVL